MQRRRTRSVASGSAVWQSAVVPRYGESRFQLPQRGRFFGPRSGMVDFGAAGQPLLKSVAVLAKIMQYPGQPGLFLSAKGAGKRLGSARRVL